MTKINWPKWVLIAWAIAGGLLSGCWGWGGWKAPELNLPEAGKTSIETKEYSKETYQLTDFCKNAIEVIVDLSNLPTYYSLNDNNTSLEVDLVLVDVPEGNTIRTIPVKCKNSDGSIDVNVTSYELDTGNDSPTSIVNSNLSTNIYVWQDYNWAVVIHDEDGGASSVSYDIIDKSNNSTVDSWYMNCVNNDSENSTCSFSVSGLDEGNYTVNIEAQWVDGGEHDQPAATMSKDFEVNEPTFSLSPDQNVDDDWAYTIALDLEGIDVNDLTFRVKWSYNENWDWQDYDLEIKPWETKMNWILSLDMNWNLTVDTTVQWYWDSTSMWSGDWMELEVTYNWQTKTSRITVN